MSALDLRDIVRDTTGPTAIKRLLCAVDHSYNQKQQRAIFQGVFDEIGTCIKQQKHVHLLLDEALKLWTVKYNTELDPLIVQSLSVAANEPIQSWINNEQKGYNAMQAHCEHNLSVQKREGEREAIYASIYKSIIQNLKWCDYDNAMQRGFEAKEWANLPQEILAINLAIIKSAFLLNSVGHVKMHALRIKSLLDQLNKSSNQSSQISNSHSNEELSSIVESCLGLVAMCGGQFQVAAQCFLNVNVKHIGSMSDCFTPGDILIYSSFLSLAVLSRKQLRDQTLPSIKQSVDQSSTNTMLVAYQSHWRGVVENFLASNYAKVYQSATQSGTYLRLDRLLSGHTDNLLALIKKRSLIEQFSPFVNLSINDLSISLGLSMEELYQLINQTINSGDLHARIDTVQQLLVKTSSTVSQSVNQAKTIELGAKGIRDIRTALLRMDCQEQNLTISMPKNQNRGRG